MMEQYKELNDVARSETSAVEGSKEIWQSPKLIKLDYSRTNSSSGSGNEDLEVYTS